MTTNGKNILLTALIAIGIFLMSACQNQPMKTSSPESPTPNPIQSALPAQSRNASPTLLPSPSPDLPLKGIIIGLDPGHQKKLNKETEPNAPHSTVMKAKVSGGTYGRFSKVYEYEVNLQVGLKLRKLLTDAGATVIMTRTTNDVNISNRERAELFNQKKTDLAIRIHCNGNNNSDTNGVSLLVPKENPYQTDCQRAAEALLEEVVAATGAKSDGVVSRSDQTGFNWCDRAIVTIEMGYMTNKKEDLLLTSDVYQDKLAQGLYNGILRYFEGEK